MKLIGKLKYSSALEWGILSTRGHVSKELLRNTHTNRTHIQHVNAHRNKTHTKIKTNTKAHTNIPEDSKTTHTIQTLTDKHIHGIKSVS